MIQVLKKTPITFNGINGWEVLIVDNEIDKKGMNPCQCCMYTDWMDRGTNANCMDVHECCLTECDYFVFVEDCL